MTALKLKLKMKMLQFMFRGYITEPILRDWPYYSFAFFFRAKDRPYRQEVLVIHALEDSLAKEFYLEFILLIIRVLS